MLGVPPKHLVDATPLTAHTPQAFAASQFERIQLLFFLSADIPEPLLSVRANVFDRDRLCLGLRPCQLVLFSEEAQQPNRNVIRHQSPCIWTIAVSVTHLPGNAGRAIICGAD